MKAEKGSDGQWAVTGLTEADATLIASLDIDELRRWFAARVKTTSTDQK